MPVFKRKDGKLTRYALACGYIQKVYPRAGLSWCEVTTEGSICFSVRRFDARGVRTHWESAGTLTEAYKLARKLAPGN